MSGLSWFGVLMIDSAPFVDTSHAQPEPKRPIPAAWNCSLNAANDPKALVMASASAPVGSPPAFGDIVCQYSE